MQRGKNRLKIDVLQGGWSVTGKYLRSRKERSPRTICARMDSTVNALELCRWQYSHYSLFAIDPACIDHYTRTVSEWSKDNAVSFGLRDMIRRFRDCIDR